MVKKEEEKAISLKWQNSCFSRLNKKLLLSWKITQHIFYWFAKRIFTVCNSAVSEIP